MTYQAELEQEREYTARVQQLLYAVIKVSRGNAEFQDDSIRMMLTDAWEELRMKPTALSQQDLDQLNAEINRFVARRTFSENRASQYEKMLKNPFFARIDFKEEGEEQLEKIVIGLYSLKDAQKNILVHDWRAPICSLYYDSMPGKASYSCPGGVIAGELTLKRQYVMENGRLKYFVNTEYSIDDSMLLDILSGATGGHMRQIVATIQSEQNAAIRHERDRVLSVTGCAGSGKTSVAMHRAAYLMYRHRNLLSAECIAVLAPTHAFSEYISCVLPELGEENVQAMTLHDLLTKILSRTVETPLRQYEALLETHSGLRRASVSWKAGEEYLPALNDAIENFRKKGPAFETIRLGKSTLITKAELEKTYRSDSARLSPAQRLSRIAAALNDRLDPWEKSLSKQYEELLFDKYRDKELAAATKIAVRQRLQPVRAQIKKVTSPDLLYLYADALRAAPEEIARAARENAEAGLIWWEDAPAIALLAIRLGFVKPDNTLRHLLVDEAQDYSDAVLHLLPLYFSKAEFTLLGDPNQRTLPAMPACDPRTWGEAMGCKDAPIVHLSRGYRSSLEIADFCNSLLPDNAEKSESFGRHGALPVLSDYSPDALTSQLEKWQKQGFGRIAVITQSQSEAIELSVLLKKAALLTGDINELEEEGIILGGLNLMKGLEFDAVAVVWNKEETPCDDERRRLYTACSRALHELAVFTVHPDR